MVFRPSTFGKYALLKRIAIGGMAEVFRAMAFGAEGFEKRVAVKRMLPHLSNDNQFVDMFINEARLAAKLNHSNIVQIYDFGCIDNLYYISMEYVHGKDIADIIRMLRQRDLGAPLELACHIMIEILNGLDYAHRLTDWYGVGLDLVHRDVSPHNIIVSYEGEVKLVDFGIAKATSSTVQTSGGVLKGKYSYMSPEQAMGKPLTRTTDVFSLGICFYELLTLSKMFQAESDLAVLEMVRDARFTPPHEINEAIPKEVEDVLLRSLAKTPAERFANAAEMRDELEHFLFKRNLRFSTSWLAGFMREVFREELDTELAEFGTEAGVIEQLYFEARSKAADMPGGGSDTVVIRRANEGHPALIVETGSILRDPPRHERAESTEEKGSFNPPTGETGPSEELVRGLEDDLEDEVDVSLLQTTLVPHPGHVAFEDGAGQPEQNTGSGPIWPEPAQEPSLTIQMEERKPTPALVAVSPTEEGSPELPLSPDEFADSFRDNKGQNSEPSWLQEPPPQIDLRSLSSSKWTRSQIFWAGFFVLCVGVVGIFLWVVQGKRGAPPSSEPAKANAAIDSEEPSAQGPNGKPGGEIARPSGPSGAETTPGKTPGDKPSDKPGDKPSDKSADKPSDKPGGKMLADRGGAQETPAPGASGPDPEGKQAAPGEDNDTDGAQKGAGKTAKRDDRKDDRKAVKKPPRTVKKNPPREESAGFGYLDVGIAGSWAYVYIDGVKIKTTPLLNHRVKAGKHKVELKDGEGVLLRRWPNVQVEGNDRIRLLHQ